MARSGSSSVINFPSAGGGIGIITIILGIIAIIALVYFFKKNPNFIRNLMGGKIGVAADAVCATGPHVYQTVGSPITDAPEEKTRCGGRSIDMGIPTTLDAYEATALILYAQGDTYNCRLEFDIKMFGPGHHADTVAVGYSVLTLMVKDQLLQVESDHILKLTRRVLKV